MTKPTTTPTEHTAPSVAAEPAKKVSEAAQTAVVNDNGLPLVSMILGIVSLVTFMWFLGIPAIILGIIALKKYATNKAFGITGIITGIVSTLFLLGTIAVLLIALLSGAFDETPQPDGSSDYYQNERYNNRYDNSGDRYYRGMRENV